MGTYLRPMVTCFVKTFGCKTILSKSKKSKRYNHNTNNYTYNHTQQYANIIYTPPCKKRLKRNSKNVF